MTAAVYPITFSVPESKVIGAAQVLKSRFLSPMIPGDFSTYVYNDEASYYKQYQESYFAITRKKAGWDCMRHYEILANGCLPVFLDLDACPERTMAAYPKQLQRQCNALYAKYEPDVATMFATPLLRQQFHAEYGVLLNQCLDYLRAHLTTRRVGEYVLDKAGVVVPSSSVTSSSSSRVMMPRVLVLGPYANADYLHSLTLHGLKCVLGKQCHEYPKVDHLYVQRCTSESTAALYGRGYSYTALLDETQYYDDAFEREAGQRGTALYYVINDKIKEHYFDLIVYGAYTRGLWFHGTVVSAYKPSEVVYLNGEDEPMRESCAPVFGTAVGGGERSCVFVRELVH